MSDWGRVPIPAIGRIWKATKRVEGMAEGGVSPDRSQWTPQFVNRFLVKEVFDDYIRCREWDGTTEGTVDFKIAKPTVLRKTPYHGKTIPYTMLGGSFSLTYSYTNAWTRTVTKSVGGTGSETQVIVPAYIGGATGDYKGEVIYAMSGVGGGTGVTLNPGTSQEETLVWLDLNIDDRMWGKV